MSPISFARSFTALALVISTVASAKGREPTIVFDKVLDRDEVIEGVPLEVGTHVVLREQGDEGGSRRWITATYPGRTLKFGPLEFSGNHPVTIEYGRPYIYGWGSNLGEAVTHSNFVQPQSEAYQIFGTLTRATRMAGVLLASMEESGLFDDFVPSVRVYCLDAERTNKCFTRASLPSWTPETGVVAEDTILDGVTALARDRIIFQADGHPAAIWAGQHHEPQSSTHRPNTRRVTLSLQRNGVPVEVSVWAENVIFTRHHRPSVIMPTIMQTFLGIPLARPGSLGHEAIIVRPDGSYTLSLDKDVTYVVDGYPVGQKHVGYGNDLEFDSQGYLRKAAVGGAFVYGGILLKPGVFLELELGRITKARLGGAHAQYAFDGEFEGRQHFIIGADLIFDLEGNLARIEGAPTTDQRLIDEYRSHDRIVFPVR